MRRARSRACRAAPVAISRKGFSKRARAAFSNGLSIRGWRRYQSNASGPGRFLRGRTLSELEVSSVENNDRGDEKTVPRVEARRHTFTRTPRARPDRNLPAAARLPAPPPAASTPPAPTPRAI